MFDRFYQSGSPELRDKGGTGIGLALVKELVQLHGGEVSADNDDGRGAVFMVTLPMIQEGVAKIASPGEDKGVSLASEIAAMEAQSEHAEPIQDNEDILVQDNLHILIVEDNDDVRKFIRTLLTEQHYHVSEATDGKEGLDIAIKETPDLILTDVMMPIMDGMALSRELRADVRTSHIPIIMAWKPSANCTPT